ncbi:hypothetical protein VIGAN_03157300 [Vigna angularis var. angularis]|uniref:Uncharacterized protein n=1 Tax=Vigna angularis var. angularis TaxID=157739 RepID=A0A0S3RM97_PHAAN|nr:hypothetical protein VIGAN_03157300 [Vigna angularis var. angularis]
MIVSTSPPSALEAATTLPSHFPPSNGAHHFQGSSPSHHNAVTGTSSSLLCFLSLHGSGPLGFLVELQHLLMDVGQHLLKDARRTQMTASTDGCCYHEGDE